jgi:hypothetical protein
MKAQLPAVYVEARQALARCARIDECKKWAAKAEALKSYAKQMNDAKLKDDAQRIRDRAMQRAGELLLELKSARGTRRKSRGGRSSARDTAAADAGLTPKQAKTAVEVARVEKTLADEMIEASPPASVTELASAGRTPQPKPAIPPYGNEWWDWTIAIRNLATLPACGLKVLAARMPEQIGICLADCRAAIEHLNEWQRELEAANVKEESADESARAAEVALS